MELIHIIILTSLLNVSSIILVIYFKSFFFNIFNNYNPIQKIHDGYKSFISTQQNLNTLVIDVSELDFVNNQEDYTNIINQIKEG